jgi:RNA polymerase sigma-70 factor (ECF subfamily)
VEGREPGIDPTEVERVEKALLTLPMEQREVVVLKMFEGLTFREIGAALGVSLNTVASRHRYALDKLRELLNTVDSDPASQSG